jgi:glycosyltransferase involved in cell wall biosynthesis
MNKIAYLCSEYPAISQTFIFSEIASLRQAGFDVTAISVHSQSQLEVMTEHERLEAANTLIMTRCSLLSIIGIHLFLMVRSPAGYLRMIAAACSLLLKGPRSPFKALAYFTEAGILVRWMKQRSIRHVHEHFAAPTAFVAMIAAKYGGIEYSLSIHGPDVFFIQEEGMLREKVLSARFVRCISHFCRSQLMRITEPDYWKNLHIVRCGVDPEVFSERKPRNNQVPELLCVGRLVPAKGQQVLLEACSLLKSKNIPFHLTFVGDGDDRSSLENYVQKTELNEQVFFAGSQGHDRIQDFYNKADIFVLPSFAEGVPVVLMEAMSKTIPVISTYIAGIQELISSNETGLLADAGDMNGLARHLKKLLADRELRIKLGSAARKKVIQDYHLHRNNLEMVRLFQKAEFSS